MQITTARLSLDPLRVEDAEEMVGVLADPSLYTFIGGTPRTAAELRSTYRRLVGGHSVDGTEEWLNWILRMLLDGRAIGTVQATIVAGGRHADIAWVIGGPWQGRGYATEAARALVDWLEQRGVSEVTAHIHPDHLASASVAQRVGLSPTDEIDGGERVWARSRRPVDPH